VVQAELALDLRVTDEHVAVGARRNERERGAVVKVYKKRVEGFVVVSPFDGCAGPVFLFVDEPAFDVHDHGGVR